MRFQLVGFFCRCSALSHLDASFHVLAATGNWTAWLCSAGNKEQEITITKYVSSFQALNSHRISGSFYHSHLHRGKEMLYKRCSYVLWLSIKHEDHAGSMRAALQGFKRAGNCSIWSPGECVQWVLHTWFWSSGTLEDRGTLAFMFPLHS